MTWTRVDDKWFGHRKTKPLSLAARGVWVTVLSWAGMFAPDGEFTQADLEDLFPREKPATLDKLVRELLKVQPGFSSGYWERTESGYRIHDFQSYRAPERDRLTPEQRSQRASAAARARWGASSNDAHEHAPSTPDGCSRASDAHAREQCGSMPPVPSRPDPVPDPDLNLNLDDDLGTLESARATPDASNKTPEDFDRETKLPLNWQPHPEAIRDICRHFSVSAEAVAPIADEFRSYWTIGAGNRRTCRNWQAKFREHCRRWLSNPAQLAAAKAPKSSYVAPTCTGTDGDF